MRKVNLRMNELEKYNVIKTLVDSDGNKNTAALKLSISRRQIDRLIINYKEKGKSSFIHGNRSKIPANTLDKAFSRHIVLLYHSKYQGCNFAHFRDLLKERENINVSYNYIYITLTKHNIYSPRIRKSTRKKLKKQQLLLKKENRIKSNDEIEAMISHLIDVEDSHPRQEKPKYFGEIIEMDGSIHLWFGSVKVCLHLAVDVCTGNVIGGVFQNQETLRGYYIVYKQILDKYGIPYKFKTDNRTVFNYESLNPSKRTSDKDVLTQFGYACKILGTDLETTSVSQAKGTIERVNGTFQGRLVQELKIEGISDIDKANDYLINSFIPSFNKRFALNFKLFPSAFESSPSKEKINYTLAILTPRKIDNGNSIKFNNVYYQPYDKNNKLVCFKSRTDCLVIKSFDGSLLVTIDDYVYQLIVLKHHKSESSVLDNILKVVSKEKTVYIPPMSHPWKASSFKKQFQNKKGCLELDSLFGIVTYIIFLKRNV